MVSSRAVNAIIQNNISDRGKIPHGVSYPVIYCENYQYYLAVFIFFYTGEDIRAGKIMRPSLWVTADIKTGEIIQEYETKDKEFSKAPYDMKYDIRGCNIPHGCEYPHYNTSEQYYEDAFAILDLVRSGIIDTGKLHKKEYRDYLDRIMADIPEEYRQFYTDLSV